MQQMFTRSKARVQSAPIDRDNANRNGSVLDKNKGDSKTTFGDSNQALRKRSLNNDEVHERLVRFKSIAEEYEFDADAYDQSGLSNASDVFKKILADMRQNSGKEEDDDNVFDGVFTATPNSSRPSSERRLSDSKKTTMPRKSILKHYERRNSATRRNSRSDIFT